MNIKTDEQPLTWSRAYWAVLLLVVGLVTFLAAGMLRESYRACHAAEIELLAITLWYFGSIGWVGKELAGLLSVAVSLAFIGLRRRIIAVVAASNALVACIGFLAVGMFSSIAPLLKMIYFSLPPAERW